MINVKEQISRWWMQFLLFVPDIHFRESKLLIVCAVYSWSLFYGCISFYLLQNFHTLYKCFDSLNIRIISINNIAQITTHFTIGCLKIIKIRQIRKINKPLKVFIHSIGNVFVVFGPSKCVYYLFYRHVANTSEQQEKKIKKYLASSIFSLHLATYSNWNEWNDIHNSLRYWTWTSEKCLL